MENLIPPIESSSPFQRRNLDCSHSPLKEPNLLEVLSLSQLGISPCRPRIQKDCWILWKRPPKGTLKLNIDGASKGNPGEAGGGGVIRNEKSTVILAFSLYYEKGSNMVAETRALLNGLRCCKAFNMSKIIVESDSKVLIDLI
ncbi:uncharacterized protein LOC143890293 [Tasmannia lanceolata]|uniref:uncharacterized protein LOC143890293 n=1 Tax=Tasmannia lanceolata TaxID=3420 RepID=UPI0040641D2E